MRVSTRSRYGLRFMAELAVRRGSGSVYMKDIAKSQDISEKYLSQILITLKSAGLVKGFRGAGGGYVLAKPASEITLKDIVGALEGDLSLVDCLSDDDECSRASICVTREIWDKLGETISRTLENITLEELANNYSRKIGEQSVMYHI